MTFKFENVYINASSAVSGPYEKKGPLHMYFDLSYDDFYMGEKTFEQGEMKLLESSIDILLKKVKKTRFDVDLHLSGDLLNQITASNYTASKLEIPFLGLYNACATSGEAMIIGATLIDSKKIKNCICSTSSHNTSAEKQFRYPTEYGGPKPKISTFTVTGGTSIFLSKDSSAIKIESATIGQVVDLGVKDVFNMGAVMAPAAAMTLYQHLKSLKREPNYYDLILTGDLGKYGKQILIEYMMKEYGVEIGSNYNDCGTMVFDLKKQPVNAGGSGAACGPLVLYGYVLEKMKNKELKRVLYIPTGALMSPTTVNQKMSIPAIAHAISLEVEE